MWSSTGWRSRMEPHECGALRAVSRIQSAKNTQHKGQRHNGLEVVSFDRSRYGDRLPDNHFLNCPFIITLK
jgi:hypothetical protein